MPRKSWTLHVDFEALRREFDNVPYGNRKAYKTQVAERIGVSYDTLQREMRRRFGRAKDAPGRPQQVPQWLVRRVAKVKEHYRTMVLKGDRRELSTRDCLAILQEGGCEEAGRWHPSTVNAALRRSGYRVQDPKQRVEAAYAGQQFQIDFSRSKHFQILEPTPDGDWLLKVSAKELHYKEGAVKLRTWIVQLRDEYSRLRLVQYYPATAESAILGVHFLRWAFGRPDDDHLMGDLPERIKADQGAFAKSKIARNLFDALQIERKLAMPGNSDSQGKVERGFRRLWQQEAKIATRIRRQQGADAKIRLSELRRMMHQATIEEHQETHPTRRGQTRGALYQQSLLRNPLRSVDTDLLQLAARTWERKADDTRLVYIDNVPLEVPPFAAGHWVRIHKNMQGAYLGELVDGYRAGKPFEVTPYEFADLDDFSGRPQQTYAQEIRQEVKNDQKVRALRSRETEAVKPDSPFTETTDGADEPETVPLVEARAAVGRTLRQLGYDEESAKRQIARLVTAGVLERGMTRADVEAVTEHLRQPQKQAV